MPLFACLCTPWALVDWLPARVGVALLTMLGLINALMVRVNLSVAIVSMVRRNLTSITQIKTQCSPSSNTSAASFLEDSTTTEVTGEDEHAITLSPALLADSEVGRMEGELDWDEVTQGIVLGSFFYGYWITQVAGGRLAEMYGTRIVFGVSVFAGGVSAVLTPLAARTHYGLLVSLRVIQGLFQGATLPCLFPLMVRWIPPYERSRFIAYILFCNNLSITVTLPLCGVVIEALGWDAAFYVTGVLSLAWCFLWFSCMYDTPTQHPRISKEELAYIEDSLESVCGQRQGKKPVPWLRIARSLPVWAILLCEAGNSYGFSVYFSYIPTYMKNILGFSVQENGFLSALPFLCRYLGAVSAATIGERLLSRGTLSVITTRRIFSAIAMLGPALNLLVVSFSSCDALAAIVLLCLGFFFNGSISVGLFANRTDITSNYSGTLSGLANGFANVVSFIVPLVVGALTQNQQTLAQWQKVFWICVPVYVLCEAFYLIFVSSSIQEWDDLGDEVESGKDDEQSQTLHTNHPSGTELVAKDMMTS